MLSLLFPFLKFLILSIFQFLISFINNFHNLFALFLLITFAIIFTFLLLHFTLKNLFLII